MTQRPVRVLEARSPIADVVEIHEMKMENNVMKMRAVPALELAAGTLMELKPGGYHVMLIGLKQQIKEGEIVPITLVLEGKDKKQETIEINALVRPLNTAKDEHHGHKH